MKNLLLVACFCFPNNTSKKYLEISKHFWGQTITYTCEYDCEKDGQKQTIIGSYKKNIIGSEKGNEIVCEGTVYEERYSTVTNWFYWEYQYSKHFNGNKSKSKTIRQFCQ